MYVQTLSAIPTAWDDPVLGAVEAATLLAQPGHTLLVCEGGGHLFGRGGVGEMGDILTLFVPQEMRRQGRAEALLQAFTNWLQAQGATGLTLEVRADNTAAQTLYAKLGLKVQHRRKAYYPDGVDGVVMAVQFRL